jgi:hypothetical protein
VLCLGLNLRFVNGVGASEVLTVGSFWIIIIVDRVNRNTGAVKIYGLLQLDWIIAITMEVACYRGMYVVKALIFVTDGFLRDGFTEMF